MHKSLNTQVTGTTSAHAENTPERFSRSTPKRNYLRARGEYIEHVINAVHPVELPPRTRRILGFRSFALFLIVILWLRIVVMPLI